MFIIAIAGSTCSGKTTLASKLKSQLPGCDIIPLDNYYKKSSLPFEERALINHDLPEELDWPLLEKHVSDLRNGKQISMPLYSFPLHARTSETLEIAPPLILILEGIHALYSSRLLEMTDLKIFLETTFDLRFSRRLERDLKERCGDIDYVKNKFHSQTERIYQELVRHYQNRADYSFSDLEEAAEFIRGKIPSGKNDS